MSTASVVPETWQLTGDDAKETLAGTDRGRLLKDAITRLRASDGLSHARSMAFLLSLVFVQGVIAAVGIASAVGSGGFSDTIVDVLQTIAPGPAGRVLTTAVDQAHQAGSSGQWLAIAFGLVGALVTGTTLLGQIERALNRLYGIEKDRDTLRKYGQAFLLAITAGVLSTLAFAGLGLGRTIASSLGGSTARGVWNVARWPIGIALLVAAIALIMRWAPRRHQPAWSWLSFGATVSVTLLALVSIALNLFFQIGSTFGETYGPLAGIVALAFWAFFTSLALLFGAALAAQLEAVRAGAATPRSPRKAAGSEPESVDDEGEHVAVSSA
ncbi:MAG TPA: YihY/virulence factor BrkB family protein [Actinomycetota bacterium]|nr:YihY/virulence factor BrkB family protein [Actinomycetota bacterium]